MTDDFPATRLEDDYDEDEEDAEDERDEDRRPQQPASNNQQDDQDGFEEDDRMEDHRVPKRAKLALPKSKTAISDDDYDEDEDQAKAAAEEPAMNKAMTGKMNEDEEEGEENPDIELVKSHTIDPEKMQVILSQFTHEQMSRYECFRRSGFQKANMRRLLQSVAGCPISVPMTIVMSGIAKMFVGELVENGRIVMTERNESGPLRPCHIREAFRRLKVKGKVPLRTRARLFH